MLLLRVSGCVGWCLNCGKWWGGRLDGAERVDMTERAVDPPGAAGAAAVVRAPTGTRTIPAGADQGWGMMTSRTRASRSASAWRKPRRVRRVAPKVSNSSGVMPSGS